MSDLSKKDQFQFLCEDVLSYFNLNPAGFNGRKVRVESKQSDEEDSEKPEDA